MKNKITALSIFIFLISVCSVQILGQTNTISIKLGINTGQDASIDNHNIQAGYFPDLVAIAWTNQNIPVVNRSLFQFYHSIPSNVNIIDARLSLYGNTNPINQYHVGANQAFLRRIISPWSAETVTWNTQPEYVTTNQVVLPESTFPLQDYLNINVTNIFRDMVNNPSAGFGFLLMLGVETQYRCINFGSGDFWDSTRRPVLQVTYSPVVIKTVSNEIPSQYVIYQNSPNPFNPVTNIKFDIPKKSFTRIEVFDILGRNVETLVNETIDAGSYSLSWSGDNFSSGEYFYRIVSDDFIETKRMTLLK
ncbi:MAG: DNRLRE domain-containing protein [Ignavibacteria bacterium]